MPRQCPATDHPQVINRVSAGHHPATIPATIDVTFAPAF
ncbi:MAG: hypothetical protein JWM45_726, partial [Pseudonocardiales bacterium]|nr:hypothetical protein [Pseudonocardiales bacterium]